MCMKYNFDEIIDRKNTKSIKYDFPNRFGKLDHNNMIPLWIADMDFRSPPCVQEAIIKRVNHGIFGYSYTGDDYFRAVSNWMDNQHGWKVEPEWLVIMQGVLSAISITLTALTNKDDAILIQYPSYNMFKKVIEETNRNVIKNILVLEDGKYRIDFDDFEDQIVRNNVKLFILCNPYNPVGRVWTEEELIRIGDICLKHGVFVISDEIHQDFVYAPHKHLVFANLKPEFKNITVTCTAPTKTFNIAGLPISNIFITNIKLRDKVKEAISKCGHHGVGIIEVLACQAAYLSGEEWLHALLKYLSENIEYSINFFRERLPEIEVIKPEGTYLLWLDCRKLGFSGKELEEYLANEAHVLLNGASSAEGFLRINIACPRATLEKAFSQIEQAIRKLRHEDEIKI
ncbi:MAG: bifunctional PLP-dependent enzyme (beta-cystathionase and maltose regulon repressor) [Clostridium sp. Maddingley MBC34-26]|nr:MAG: bifunctional PLP-dependent enzyme (beta-cystathionase and maltose regulon repressor) [Clostridium sp. Maddingley MBC34-26]